MTARPRDPSARPPGARLVAVAAFVLAYVLLDWVSYVDPYGPLAITPWNPPPGLAVFVLLRLGWTTVPWLFAATFLAQVLLRGAPAPWPVVVVACAWLACAYAGVALLLQRMLRFGPRIATLRDATGFAAAAVACTLVIGAVYIGIYAAAGVVTGAAYLRTVAQFWIGDLIGIVVTTPLLLVLPPARSALRAAYGWETAAQVAAIVLALWVVFGSRLGEELKLFYVLFLPLIWIAMRRGLAGTTVATALVQVGLIASLQLVGHAPGEVLDFQFLMLALALTGLFLGVTVDERRAAEQKLRRKQAELDRTLRAAAASEVASTLAHELNQPLSAIATYSRACQILLERGDPDRELAPTMGKVVAEVNRAGTVVHRLRELVRSGGMHSERLAPGALLSAVAESVRARAQRHEVAIVLEGGHDLPEVMGDRIQLETVVHNLVNNAIEALEEVEGPRTVTVAATRHRDGFVQLTVSDNGPGIDPAIAPTLFEPLATSKVHGLGLGLAISRTIVEAHGGSLWLAGSGSGASFSLTLPIAR